MKNRIIAACAIICSVMILFVGCTSQKPDAEHSTENEERRMTTIETMVERLRTEDNSTTMEDGGMTFMEPVYIQTDSFDFSPVLPGKYEIEKNNQTELVLGANDWNISIKKISAYDKTYDEMTAKVADGGAVDISDIMISDNLKNLYEKCCCFLTFEEETSTTGYIFIIKDYFSGDWIIEYYGHDEIITMKTIAFGVINGFDLKM